MQKSATIYKLLLYFNVFFFDCFLFFFKLLLLAKEIIIESYALASEKKLKEIGSLEILQTLAANEGPVKEIMKNKKSYTGQYLKRTWQTSGNW